MKSHFLIGIILMVCAVGLVAFRSSNLLERSYSIEHHKLLLEGSSNVNDFECICQQDFGKDKVKFEYLYDWGTVSFQRAQLAIKVASFDCGKRAINKDLQKTLQVDQYPHIKIELLDIKHLTEQLLGDTDAWVEMKAYSRITLAGFPLETELGVQGKKLSNQRFRFKATKPLHMSDFNLEPPTALFGLIKVKDKITIHIDLEVSVEDV